MTPGQTRVLVLLGVLLGVQAIVNPTFQANAKAALSGNAAGALSAGTLGWGLSAVALVALAAPAPSLATWIVVIFITLALLEHPQAWASALGKATAQMGAFMGSSPASTGSSQSGK